MATFIFEFEELPLSIVDRIEVGYVNGSVEVNYNRHGEWGLVVGSVCLEGYKKLSFAEREAGKKPWVYAPAPDAVAAIIANRLENEWHDRVSSAVQDQLEADREAAAENRADMIREDRMAVL